MGTTLKVDSSNRTTSHLGLLYITRVLYCRSVRFSLPTRMTYGKLEFALADAALKYQSGGKKVKEKYTE